MESGTLQQANVDRVIDVLAAKQAVPSATRVQQQLRTIFGRDVVGLEHIVERFAKVDKWKRQLEHLKTLPVIEQRSQLWYDTRDRLITASDAGVCLGFGKFGTPGDVLKKKCSYEDVPFIEAPPLKWGTMLEDVANSFYEHLAHTKVHEFGLLPHPTESWFGASPDGIASNGVMLEIKTPYRRRITGEISDQYYYQIQGQLEVCGLEECDFLEVSLEMYGILGTDPVTGKRQDKGAGNLDHAAHFFTDDTSPADPRLTCGGAAKGAVLEAGPFETGARYKYLYSPWGASSPDVLRWVEDTQARQPEYGTLHLWHMEKFNILRVYRDDAFVARMMADVGAFWKTVLKAREDRGLYDAFLTSAKGRQQSTRAVGPPRASGGTASGSGGRKQPWNSGPRRSPAEQAAVLEVYAFLDD